MKYILRTLWVIGCIPVAIFTIICFFVIAIACPFSEVFFFIKEGRLVDYSFSFEFIIKIWDVYEKLLKYIEDVH